MEKILHFTVPKKLTPVQAHTIERARELHPGWDIKVWQDPVHLWVPAREIVLAECKFGSAIRRFVATRCGVQMGRNLHRQRHAAVEGLGWPN